MEADWQKLAKRNSSAEVSFGLYDTFGLPYELTELMLKKSRIYGERRGI